MKLNINKNKTQRSETITSTPAIFEISWNGKRNETKKKRREQKREEKIVYKSLGEEYVHEKKDKQIYHKSEKGQIINMFRVFSFEK